MSLTSSLFSGVSGLTAMGNSMTVIGDNIANVNTVGFKASRVTFQDVMSQSIATNAGSAQVGRGTSLGDITGMFKRGSFESTESPTDLAIGGDGFFIVRNPNSNDEVYYTRFGEFRFDKNGFFTTPAGHIVQGWEVQRNATTDDVEDVGSITDIQLGSFTSPPEETTVISLIANLDSEGEDNTTGTGIPLSEIWDGDPASPTNIGATAYEYQTTVKVYDSLGSTHDVTVYFDRADDSSTYEYIVTCNPSEDNRQIFSATDDAGLGMLGRGTLTFTTDGIMQTQTFERFVGNSGGAPAVTIGTGPWAAPADYPVVGGDWTGDPALLLGGPPATHTYTMTAANTGIIGTDAVNLTWGATGSLTIPADYAVGDSLEGPDGLFYTFSVGSNIGAVGDSFVTTIYQGDSDAMTNPYSWSDMTGVYENQHFSFAPDFLGAVNGGTIMNIELDMGSGFDGTNWAPEVLSTTQFASASTTVYQSYNGYGAGSLDNISVDIDGVITGQYSNGQVAPLFRVALAKFLNVQGLYKQGENLFSATRTSGSAITNRPGENGLGKIAPNSLEQSNVDMAGEFVKMITTQSAYQANSKIVTTVDTMLGDTIAMKR